MRKIHITLILTTLLSTQPLLANQDMSSAACNAVAKACLDAGYTRSQDGDKKFWQGCMKPIILGKTVQGVTVDAKTAKTCRTDKIAQLKNDLHEFQNAASKRSQ